MYKVEESAIVLFHTKENTLKRSQNLSEFERIITHQTNDQFVFIKLTYFMCIDLKQIF